MITENYKDFTVIYENTDYQVNFTVYEVIARDKDDIGNYTVPNYEGVGGCGCDDKMTADIEKANKFIEGTIKWDGCSHFTFGDKDKYMHLCGKHSIKNLLFVIDKIYKRSGELMANSDITQFE